MSCTPMLYHTGTSLHLPLPPPGYLRLSSFWQVQVTYEGGGAGGVLLFMHASSAKRREVLGESDEGSDASH